MLKVNAQNEIEIDLIESTTEIVGGRLVVKQNVVLGCAYCAKIHCVECVIYWGKIGISEKMCLNINRLFRCTRKAARV